MLSLTTVCSKPLGTNIRGESKVKCGIYAMRIRFKSILRETVSCRETPRHADMGTVCARLRIDLPTSVNVTAFRVEIDYYWNMNMSTNLPIAIFVQWSPMWFIERNF